MQVRLFSSFCQNGIFLRRGDGLFARPRMPRKRLREPGDVHHFVEGNFIVVRQHSPFVVPEIHHEPERREFVMGSRSDISRMPHIVGKVHPSPVVAVARAAVPHKELFAADRIRPDQVSRRIQETIDEIGHPTVLARQRIGSGTRFGGIHAAKAYVGKKGYRIENRQRTGHFFPKFLVHIFKIGFIFSEIKKIQMFEDCILEGRWALENGRARVSAPAGSVSFAFEGTEASLELEGEARWLVEIDGQEAGTVLSRERKLYRIAENLSEGIHRATVSKMTETELGSVSLYSVRADTVKLQPAFPKRQIEFIGDSYTVGFGNMARDPITGNAFSTTDATKSYGALLAGKLGAAFAINAYSGRGLVQNFMGIAPRWTIPELYRFTLGGEAPLKNSPLWDFSRFSPETVCLFIGINDFQGEFPHPTAEAFDTAYSRFLDFLRERNPKARFILLSTEVFPVNTLPERIESVLAKEISRGNRDIAHLFLETPRNRGLDFHPSAERHRQMAEALYQKILNISRGI